MTPLTSLRMVDRTDDLETHIDELVRQRDILQSIESLTNDKVDFGDLLETYNLLVEEIERLQKELREQKGNIFSNEEFEEEEEEILSPKYSIEHLIRDKDGKLRPLKPGDLDIERHEGVRAAFKLFYEIQKECKPCRKYGKGE